MTTNLREAVTKITVEGQVNEVNLERTKDKEGKDIIRGDLQIKVGDNNIIKVSAYSRRLKNDGNPNSIYTGLETIIDEYKSIAQSGTEGADWVRVSGSQDRKKNKGYIRPFVTQQGKAAVQYSSNFFNRINNRTPDPKAEFECELYYEKAVPEVDREGNETGRVKITGWLPCYNGIGPVELVAEEEIADQLTGYLESGNTYNFLGDLVNTQTVTEIEVPVAIGKPRKEKRITYVNKMLISGVSDPYDLEDDDPDKKAFDPEAVKLAIQQYKDGLNNVTVSVNNSGKPAVNTRGRSLVI